MIEANLGFRLLHASLLADLMIKFDKADVQSLFTGLPIPGVYTIEVTGKVSGIEFRAFDRVKVL